jgi:hypothetical protein
MLRHAIAPARFFSQTPNDLIRHPRLSSCAVRLLQWALSLPEGSRETLGSIGEKLTEGRTTVRNARRQLAEEGFVHTRRSQDPATGCWQTRVLISNVPLTDKSEIAAAFGELRASGASSGGCTPTGPAPTGPGTSDFSPTDHMPTVGEPTGRAVGASTKVEKNEENTPQPTPSPTGLAATPPSFSPEPPSPPRESGRAAALLARLGDREPRLRLGKAEVLRLAPIAAHWLSRSPRLYGRARRHHARAA